ncbi:RCC1-like G exchanging factor-like protein [Chrysoperla carnea]|uniref:RCC1-like G exchanging factor-like protein n=1 Tax=Chrysoperla carnea TaxID=189513 RepID=UPI001D090D1F|nr:RCC1-like G exchanging factor-like protein [Chrysoperla carnea]
MFSNKLWMQRLFRIKPNLSKNVHSKRKFPLNPNIEEELPTFEYTSKSSLRNRVYVFGRAETGALGIKINGLKGCQYLKSPKRSTFAELNEIEDITCGYGFTAFAVNSKNDESILYGCGINTDSQIGFHTLRNNKVLDYILLPQPIPLPLKSPKSAKVLSLSAGRAHLVVLTNEGLFTLGNNAYGQCGRPIIEDEKYSGNATIYQVPQFDPNDLLSVQCGQDHTHILTKNGEVYSCGWSADGQTGLGHFNNQSTFSAVHGDISGERIIKIACTADCVLVLSEKGEVFGWGNSEYGQLPGGETQQINSPIHVNEKWGKIVDIASGGSFCMALNENGEVFVWGYGLLGLGPEVMQSNIPTKIPGTLFGSNSFDTDCVVRKINCGISYMTAINTNGDLYTWGRNTAGNLGLGHLNNQYFPLKVAVGGYVKKVTCSFDHTVIICEPFA